MKVTVTTRHLADNLNPEKLKAYALKKSRRIGKYLKSDEESTVKFVLWTEKFRDNAEITIKSKVLKTASTFETTDMLAAIDGAVDTIISKLKKETDKKITAKRRGLSRSQDNIPASVPSGQGPADISAVKVRRLSRKLMTVEEALLQLNASGESVVAFRNSATSDVNVLYVDNDGQITLVEP
ncbi:MAG: HPF/RaiA family ribosome-associated protein [Candidatus Dadabacteria bacterium]|nr:HPF/RaiA family ribosome-associated protein [Candidatus Dadabacteria bacterium]